MIRPVVLTIAGSDPSGGAGVQADLKVFADFGVLGVSAITAITAQNNRGVVKVAPVAPSMIKKQIEVLLEEFRLSGMKIGMTGADDTLPIVASIIKKYGLKNIVLDTVLRSTNNVPLAGKSCVKQIIKMLPLVTLVAPNIPEAEKLTGIKITNVESMKKAAIKLYELGATNVLIKGGHLTGDAIDVLYDGTDFHFFKGRRIKGRIEIFHGTGCILSSAIAANLARGLPLEESIRNARMYLIKTIERRRAAE